ncbi:MAG: amidohydrolase family protein, partial [Mucilaginibacter sp.]
AGPLLTSARPDQFNNLAKNDRPLVLFKTPEQARKLVKDELAYKPDLIKIWFLTDLGNHKSAAENARSLLPSVIAIINEAHKNKLKVAVHATERITAQLAVQAGADYLVHGIDDEIINDDFVRLLKKSHTILCPTLMVDDGYENTFGQTLQFSSYEIAKSNPFQLGSLFDLKHLPDSGTIKLYKQKSISIKAKTNTRDSIRMVNVAKLANAGVTVVTGTDAGNIGTLHAISYFTELKLMQQSGMSNWQILQASTINGAKILNKESEFGAIAAGKLANMILLNGNPVTDISSLQKIQLVINKGEAINPDTLIHITPEALVQQQLNAYNAHNLEAFLDTYSDDVELYDFPGKLVCRGKEQMRKIYSFLNHSPELHCQVKTRVIQGGVIIDKEVVTGVSDLGESTAIYETENGKIKKVYFIN